MAHPYLGAREALYREHFQLSQDLQERGVLIGANQLHPVTAAKTVRVQRGDRFVTDGPLAETKETLGGYYLIDVDLLHEALEWAAKIPSARFNGEEAGASPTRSFVADTPERGTILRRFTWSRNGRLVRSVHLRGGTDDWREGAALPG